jgi:hypothetical protein
MVHHIKIMFKDDLIIYGYSKDGATIPKIPFEVGILKNNLCMIDLFKKEVDEGLSANPKFLPSKYFYDKKGDELFVKIIIQNR